MTLYMPDNFKNNWYGWVTNQWAHCLLGQILFAVMMIASFSFGEFASRAVVWFAMAFLYIGWEVATYRSGKWWDAIEDAMFVCGYGAGGIAVTFHEVTPGSDYITGDAMAILPIIGLFAFHSTAGVLLRLDKVAAD